MKRSDSGEIRFRASGWDVILNDNGAACGIDWRGDFARLLDRLERPDEVLKHDHRALVGTVNLDGVKFVVKQFTTQATWFGFQLASVLFPSLGEIAYRNGIRLDRSGILTPIPVLLMQRSRAGMVIDSWMVYPYLEGRQLEAQDADRIVSFIKRMHESGWVHRDPHPANFIDTPAGVATIDTIRVRRSRSPYLKAYDLLLLSRDIPGAVDIYGSDNVRLWIPLARLGDGTLHLYRRAKHLIRGVFGIAGNH